MGVRESNKRDFYAINSKKIAHFRISVVRKTLRFDKSASKKV